MNQTQSEIVSAIKQGATIPPSGSLNAVIRGTASTAESNAVRSFAMTYTTALNRGETLASIARNISLATLAAVVATAASGNTPSAVAGQTHQVVNQFARSEAVAAGRDDIVKGIDKVMQTHQQSVVKMTGIGYVVNFVEGESGDPDTWHVGLTCPDLENQFVHIVEQSNSGGGDEALSRSMAVAQSLVPFVTARDGASFIERITDLGVPVMTNSEVEPEITMLGLFVLPHRIRHASVIRSIQVQASADLYPAVAGGTAKIYVDGDLVYEDVDGVLFTRALQGDATPVELPVELVIEAHSKVEMLLELSQAIPLSGARTIVPALSGALRVSRL